MTLNKDVANHRQHWARAPHLSHESCKLPASGRGVVRWVRMLKDVSRCDPMNKKVYLAVLSCAVFFYRILIYVRFPHWGQRGPAGARELFCFWLVLSTTVSCLVLCG